MPILVNGIDQDLKVINGSAKSLITTQNHLLMQIFIKAATNTTTFDVKLTDRYNNDTYNAKNNIGTLNDKNVNLLTYGNYTLTIENANRDESFDVLIVIRED